MMKPKRIKYTIAVVMIWVLLAAAGAIGYYAQVIPAQIESDKKVVRTQQNYQRILTVQRMENPLNRARANTRVINYEDAIKEFTVTEEGQNALIFKISELANTLRLKEFSTTTRNKGQLSTTEKVKTIRESFLTVEFRSSYHSFAEFINRLERNTPYVFVETIRISGDHEDPTHNRVEIDLSYLVQIPPDKQKKDEKQTVH